MAHRFATTLLRVIDYVLLPLFLLWLVWVVVRAIGLVINTSNSMPLGLYHRNSMASIERGQTVEVCLPDAMAAVGRSRGYLTRQHWPCLNGTEPVVKKIIATPRDQVTVTRLAMAVTDSHGHRQTYVAPSERLDSRGRPMPRTIGFGPQPSGYWLYGENNVIHSWDSRYYGPVPRSAIQSVLRPLWVFPHHGPAARADTTRGAPT